MSTREIITNNLKYIQSVIGKTRKEIAGALGFKDRTWASYLEGRATPPIENMITICDYFKINIDDLVRLQLEDLYEYKSIQFFSKKQ